MQYAGPNEANLLNKIPLGAVWGKLFVESIVGWLCMAPLPETATGLDLMKLHTLGEHMRPIFAVITIPCIGLVLSACAPSEASVATAIALTQASAPTATVLPPTETGTPTPTLTPEPTATPSPTPDLRVIDTDPRNLLLEREDLPSDARYYLPNSSWISPHRNSEVVSGWGVEEGREYLEKTGRIDGWFVSFERGTSTVNAPEEIYDNVVLYKTVEGARLVLDQFSSCMDPDSDYQIVDTDLLIGDGTIVCTSKEMQPSGKNRLWYRIEFIRRNVFHAVVGWGWEREVTPEYVEEVARTLLAKTDNAPLASEVSYSP